MLGLMKWLKKTEEPEVVIPVRVQQDSFKRFDSNEFARRQVAMMQEMKFRDVATERKFWNKVKRLRNDFRFGGDNESPDM